MLDLEATEHRPRLHMPNIWCSLYGHSIVERLAKKFAVMNNDLDALELVACTPELIRHEAFNLAAGIPYGCTTDHIYAAMNAFIDFLRVINLELHAKGMERLESLLMPANFSSIVSEFMNVSIPKFCGTLAKNAYHNGHPDLIRAGVYPNNSVQYAHDGIEVKASRYLSGWQGHNAEESWLMVFVFDSNRPIDLTAHIPPRPFKFLEVVGASLTRGDWKFSGRSETSRRTITASVTPNGAAKMQANWIYRVPGMGAGLTRLALGSGVEPEDKED